MRTGLSLIGQDFAAKVYHTITCLIETTSSYLAEASAENNSHVRDFAVNVIFPCSMFLETLVCTGALSRTQSLGQEA